MKFRMIALGVIVSGITVTGQGVKVSAGDAIVLPTGCGATIRSCVEFPLGWSGSAFDPST